MSESSASPVSLEIGNGIALLTLDNPERMNAVNAAMHAALRDALDRIEAHPDIGALILTGRGKAFCAGQDLHERKTQLEQGGVDLVASLEENYNPLLRRLVDLPFPVIAAVNGVAAGAGAALALACDIVLAARNATFQFAFARVALGPDSGCSYVLPRLVGQARALGLALTARPISAEIAADWGLIWESLPDEGLLSAAHDLATTFAAGPRNALASIKRQLREAACKGFEECLAAERDAQGVLGNHPHYREAVSAFTSKRKPDFRR